MQLIAVPHPKRSTMTPQEYLQNRLENSSKYELTAEDKKIIQFEGIKEFAYRKLKSKKFRKTSIPEESEQQIRKAIELNVSQNQPIKFTYPFGGYKIWRIDSYPTVDWAEFFTMAYVSEYVAPIVAAYEPGVEFYFSSDDICIELLDNYPRKDLDAYVDSFRTLIGYFEKFFPKNYKMELKRVAEIYTKDEYEKELNELYKKHKEIELPPEKIERNMQLSEFNFQPKGKEDYSKLSTAKREKLVLDLMIWSNAYLDLSKRRAFVRGEDKIVLFSNPISNAIDIGSTKLSKAKFWTGKGVLEKNRDSYLERILSPKQWEEVKGKAKNNTIDFIKERNFEQISIFEERLNFKD